VFVEVPGVVPVGAGGGLVDDPVAARAAAPLPSTAAPMAPAIAIFFHMLISLVVASGTRQACVGRVKARTDQCKDRVKLAFRAFGSQLPSSGARDPRGTSA
jgi:hypothetical protein